jgi:hypothetical protein
VAPLAVAGEQDADRGTRDPSEEGGGKEDRDHSAASPMGDRDG